MKKQNLITIGIIIAIFVVAIFGFIQLEKFRVRQAEKKPTVGYQPLSVVTVPAVETEKAPEEFVKVEIEKNLAKNAVVFTVSGLAKKEITTLEYELTYETRGTIQGVNNGMEPIALKEGQDEFSKEIFLGTCSAGGKCVYDQGVKSVNLTLKLHSRDGKIYEWSKEEIL